MVHECLERRRSIAETEKHHCGFIEAEGSNECSLPLIFVMNANIVTVYPHWTSNLVKSVESFMSSINSGMSRRGYPLWMVWLLR